MPLKKKLTIFIFNKRRKDIYLTFSIIIIHLKSLSEYLKK